MHDISTFVVVAALATTACSPTTDPAAPIDDAASGPHESIPLAQREHFAGHLGDIAVAVADLATGRERTFELAPPSRFFTRWNLEVVAAECTADHQLHNPMARR